MIPASFEYHRAHSVAEAVDLLGKYGSQAKLLAGGHSLIPMLKLRLAHAAHLIDIGRLQDLKAIRDEGKFIAIGALTPHAMIESSGPIRAKIPLLSEVAGQIGDVQVRNMGTIGGSLSHADPAADYPAAILAAEAEIVAQGLKGRRTVKAADFFVALFATALLPDEILLEVRVPVPKAKTGSAYLKFPNPASGFAVVGCAAMVTARDGKCSDVRIAFTGLASKAFRATGVEKTLAGQPATDAAVKAAAEKAVDGVTPGSDTFASAAYRANLAKVYARRALTQAIAKAQ